MQHERDLSIDVPAYGAVGSYTVHHSKDRKRYQATCDMCGKHGPVTIGWNDTDEWLAVHHCKTEEAKADAPTEG